MHKFRIKDQKKKISQLRGWQSNLAGVKLFAIKKFLYELKVHTSQLEEQRLNWNFDKFQIKNPNF
jgi:hypothetical protein